MGVAESTLLRLCRPQPVLLTPLIYKKESKQKNIFHFLFRMICITFVDMKVLIALLEPLAIIVGILIMLGLFAYADSETEEDGDDMYDQSL